MPFDVWRENVRRIHRNTTQRLDSPYPWTCAEYLAVIGCFWYSYEAINGEEPPKISAEKMAEVMAKLHRDENGILYVPGDYPEIIVRYLHTPFAAHTLPHLVSGRIREIKTYEIMADR